LKKGESVVPAFLTSFFGFRTSKYIIICMVLLDGKFLFPLAIFQLQKFQKENQRHTHLSKTALHAVFVTLHYLSSVPVSTHSP
jgi:hypothetical protein